MDWRKRYDPEQSVGKSYTNRGAFILGVYSPQIFDGTTSVKYFGFYSPQIFDGTTSVKYLGGVDPPNI